jgi:hypothetical protein
LPGRVIATSQAFMPVSNNPSTQFLLGFKGCYQIIMTDLIGFGRSGDIVDIKIGYRGSYNRPMFIIDRIMDKGKVNMWIHREMAARGQGYGIFIGFRVPGSHVGFILPPSFFSLYL